MRSVTYCTFGNSYYLKNTEGRAQMPEEGITARRPTVVEVTKNVGLIGELGAFSPGLRSLRENRERSRRSLRSEFGGFPLLQQGELDFSPAEKRFLSEGGL
jgi:hypothetical protein